jgi:hypothetical protein
MAEILASENLVEKLRELTKADASVIRTHYKQIGQSFLEDAAHYLEQDIRKDLKRTYSRGGYQRIAETVREFGGYAGKPAMVKFVDDLVSSYSNRGGFRCKVATVPGEGCHPFRRMVATIPGQSCHFSRV